VIVKKFVFNNKKNDIIILIHGLYTTSGFWLAYLPLFKNFKIIAFDINYDKLFENKFFSDNIFKNEFNVNGNVVGIISHSFGTVISDLSYRYNNDIIHKICPVAFSKKIGSSSFMLDIANRTRLSEDLIYNNNKIASAFISSTRDFINYNGQIYIPNMDCYFSYNVPVEKKIEFNGDHFNIKFALINIIDKIMSNKIKKTLNEI